MSPISNNPLSKTKSYTLIIWIACGLLGVGLLVAGMYAIAKAPSWQISYRIEAPPASNHAKEETARLDLYKTLSLAIIALFSAVVIGRFLTRRHYPSIANGGMVHFFPITAISWWRSSSLAILILIGLIVGAHKLLVPELTIQPHGIPTPIPTPPVLQDKALILRLAPEGPTRIYANQQVPIGVTISMEALQANNDEIVLDRTQQYLVSTRLQPGAFDISAEYLKPREEFLRAGVPVKWNWILAPKLDRIGEQKIAFDTEVYDQTHKLKFGSRSLIATIDVRNPLGLPNWVVYLVPLVGLMALVPLGNFVSTEISNRLKERRERNRAASERQQQERKASTQDKSVPSPHRSKKKKKK